MKKCLVLLLFCLVSSWAEAQKPIPDRLKLLEKNLSKTTQQAAVAAVVDVRAQAQKYLSAYYGRTRFDDPQWVRVQNFLTWLEKNQSRLNQQFTSAMGSEWAKFSAQQREVALGAWLGMKYALEQIGHTSDKQFPIILEEKIWNTECGDYSTRKTIYCSKGDFASKVNIALHETVHLLPYLRQKYQRGQDFEDSYRELYTVAAQLRYALPVKLKNNFASGARRFLPTFDQARSNDLLNEYAEGIAALIDYESIWKRTWDTKEDNSNESLDQRLRSETLAALKVSRHKDSSFYSARANAYFAQVGQEIARQYCNKLPADPNTRVQYIHACFDKHLPQILALSVQKLRPLISPKIPPVPKGYH